MKKLLYISIISIILLFTACKRNNASIIVPKNYEETTTVVVEEVTKKDKTVYIGMPREEYSKIGLTINEDYFHKFNNHHSFLDGDEGVIVTFDTTGSDGKIVDIKRFKEPEKPVKASELKENMTIYEVIETVGVKNYKKYTGNHATTIYVMVYDDVEGNNEKRLYEFSVDNEKFYEDDYKCTFGAGPFYNRFYSMTYEEALNECKSDNLIKEAVDVGKIANLNRYDDIIESIGYPQRCTEWREDGVVFEWDVVKDRVIYEIEFRNRLLSTDRKYELEVIRKELKFVNNNS